MKRTYTMWNVVCVFVLLALLPQSVHAQSYPEAAAALNQSQVDMQALIDAGISVYRINDTLQEAQQLFAAQTALEVAGGEADYSLILKYTDQIAEWRKTAEQMHDEYKALERRIQEIGNQSQAYPIFMKAKQELADERYEQFSDLVEEAYITISEEQALRTRVRAIYLAGTQTAAQFLKDHWKQIVIILIALILFYSFSRKAVAVWLINRKIHELQLEKEVLKKLVATAQNDYFHLFKIPEQIYHIRIEKYGQIIRDLDRQVPVLIEQREMILKTGKLPVKRKARRRHTAFVIVVLVLAAIFVWASIYFELVSYGAIGQWFSIRYAAVNNQLYYLLNRFGPAKVIITGILLLYGFIYIVVYSILHLMTRLKSKETKFKPKFISYYLNKWRLALQKWIQKIKEAYRHKGQVKLKKEEEKGVAIYMRKQRIKNTLLWLPRKFMGILKGIGLKKEKHVTKEHWRFKKFR